MKMTKEDLKNPEFIISNLYTKIEHMTKIRNIIEKEKKEFLDYFNEETYFNDEEFYEQPFLAFLCDRLVFNWCGCAVGKVGRLEVLFKLMTLADDNIQKKISYKEYQKRIADLGGDEVFSVLMDLIGNFSLFSHGGSCFGAWLDYDGLFVFECLKLFFQDQQVAK
jgi:hypothetical protein